MHDPVLKRFLAHEFEQGMALAADSDILDLVPLDALPATRYLAAFKTVGLCRDAAGQISEHDRWVFGVWFPPDYLRSAPHPGQVLTNLTQFNGAEEAFHPNLRGPSCCLKLQAGTGLNEIVHRLHELISYAAYSTADCLNPAAAEWVLGQDPRRFPLDRRPLKRRVAAGPVPTRMEVVA